MKADHDILIRISPDQGKVTVEEDDNGVLSRKSIDKDSLLECF